jgi:acyl-CoA thioester hydrolase
MATRMNVERKADHSESARAHAAPVRVYYEDTDAAGIVYYANYLKFAERARTELLRQAGLTHPRLVSDYGIAFVVRRCVVDYLSPARLDDELTVYSDVVDARCASVVLDQRIQRHETLIASLRVTLACLGMSGKVARVPAAVRAALAPAIRITAAGADGRI